MFNGSVELKKTTLIAKGFSQKYCMDYEETSVLTKISTIHTLLMFNRPVSGMFFKWMLKTCSKW